MKDLKINQIVAVKQNDVDAYMWVKGVVIGFTAKRIKCDVFGIVGNYHPKNVKPWDWGLAREIHLEVTTNFFRSNLEVK